MGEGTEIGLVMQGGGALGAYEYGAVQALLEHGYRPTIISGVSIGAINTAVLAGARDGDMRASIDRLWKVLTMPTVPFLPVERQAMLSAFGNPAFWAVRHDWTDMRAWTNFYDTKPLEKTLREIVDFDRINAKEPPVRMAVTATCVETGRNRRFANYDPNRKGVDMATLLNIEDIVDLPNAMTIKGRTTIGPEHVMASGALPPSFPGVWIDGQTFWDGGLFDNTPLRPLIEMLTVDEAESLPIVIINLFPENAPVPRDLAGVQDRMAEIQYQSRFADAYGGMQGTHAYGGLLRKLLHLSDKHPEVFGEIRREPQFQRLLLYRALRNLHVIPAQNEVVGVGAMDFSAYGIERRRAAGFRAVEDHLKNEGGHLRTHAWGTDPLAA